MRHRKKFNHLGRTAAHRKAMLSNMATSLIIHKRIRTTVAKAKELRVFIEPIITRAKEDSTHSRRMVFRKLQNKDAVNELFRDIATKIGERQGGYTRILKTTNRLGDNAEMCLIELVDYNENMLAQSEERKARSSRRRRRKSSDAGEKAVEAAPVAKETPAEPVAENEANESSEEPKE